MGDGLTREIQDMSILARRDTKQLEERLLARIDMEVTGVMRQMTEACEEQAAAIADMKMDIAMLGSPCSYQQHQGGDARSRHLCCSEDDVIALSAIKTRMEAIEKQLRLVLPCLAENKMKGCAQTQISMNVNEGMCCGNEASAQIRLGGVEAGVQTKCELDHTLEEFPLPYLQQPQQSQVESQDQVTRAFSSRFASPFSARSTSALSCSGPCRSMSPMRTRGVGTSTPAALPFLNNHSVRTISPNLSPRRRATGMDSAILATPVGWNSTETSIGSSFGCIGRTTNTARSMIVPPNSRTTVAPPTSAPVLSSTVMSRIESVRNQWIQKCSFPSG